MQIQKTEPRKSDKYIPWYFVAFFVVFLSFDGVFLYLATSSHRGVVEENTYQRGLNYNDTVAAAEAQTALGWQSTLSLADNNSIELQLKDAENRPLMGAIVTTRFFRPTQAGGDFTVRLLEAKNGLYRSARINAVPGQWELRVFVQWKHQHYQINQRILVPKA